MNTNSTVVQQKDGNALAERTSPGPVFVPRCDIFENQDGVVLLADMPGVDEKSIHIDLEADVLTLSAAVSDEHQPERQLVYQEYRTGGFERSFTLSEEVNTAGIEATIKNGVLKVVLPKMEKAKPKKIAVQVG